MVKVKFWLAEEWARLEAVPPVAEMSSSVKVAGSIGSPKSTATVTDAALVGEVVSVDRAGLKAVLSKVTDRALEAVLPLSAGSVTRPAGMEAVTCPSASGVMVKVKFWLAEEWARLEAVPPVAEMSSSVKVAGSIGSPKSTATVTDAALVGEVVSVDRAGLKAVLSKVTDRALEAVLLLSAGSVTRPAGMEAVTSPSASGVMVKVKFWLAEEWARLEAVPPATDMSARTKVAGSIGSPKSTATVTDAALVGESASVDRVGPGAVLSKVTNNGFEAVLPLSAGSVTRSAGMEAVTSPSASGVMVKVKFWLAEEWARLEAVPPATDMSARTKVAGSIGSPKSTVTVTEPVLVGEAVSVVRVGTGAVVSSIRIGIVGNGLYLYIGQV